MQAKNEELRDFRKMIAEGVVWNRMDVKRLSVKSMTGDDGHAESDSFETKQQRRERETEEFIEPKHKSLVAAMMARISKRRD